MFGLMQAGQKSRAAAQTIQTLRASASAAPLKTPTMAMDAIMAKRTDVEILSTASGK
jgi:hypothetical protein